MALSTAYALVGIQGDKLMSVAAGYLSEGYLRLDPSSGFQTEIKGEFTQSAVKGIHAATRETALRLPLRTLFGKTQLDLLIVLDPYVRLQFRHEFTRC
jgi:hypothetical protein